ncbi:MAG: DUF438 domain-containing protein [Vicinamibacterales bacterium]
MSELIDNAAQRVTTMKNLIGRLHSGESETVVKPLLETLVGQCSPAEVATMEQQLIAEGTPVADIMRMCDVHAKVLAGVVMPRRASVPPGHPVSTFLRENKALLETCARLRAQVALIEARPAGASIDASHVDAARRACNDLMDVDKHYLRKEHLLFPFLERYGITGPSKVMWGKDDEARAMLRGLHAALGAPFESAPEWIEGIRTTLGPALDAVEQMTVREERMLLPMALERLADLDWAQVWEQSPSIGWCLVEPEEGWRPDSGATTPAHDESRAAASMPDALRRGTVVLPTGAVNLHQLTAIFNVLPFDLTFVDADDRVAFFTEGPGRIFHRARTVVGRKVQHCHPPASVAIVDRILADFREGRQDVAAFWINFRGRFVHIRYFAVRGPERDYMGTLEVTQDLTTERALEGERRLLAYD